MKPRLLVIEHETTCPPGWFGTWLSEAGIDVDVIAAHERQAVPAELADHTGLLVLGGRMGANDDHSTSWLHPTRRLIATTVGEDAPFLGICLGHQLAAVALGGQVQPNSHGHSHGLTPFTPTAAGSADPLLGSVPTGAPAVQWNNDVVSVLPSGATRLATSPDGTVQAARFGHRAWGVQFHPEASPGIFRGWTVDRPDAEQRDYAGVDTERAVHKIQEHEPQLRRTWAPVAAGFAAMVWRAWHDRRATTTRR